MVLVLKMIFQVHFKRGSHRPPSKRGHEREKRGREGKNRFVLYLSKVFTAFSDRISLPHLNSVLSRPPREEIENPPLSLFPMYVWMYLELREREEMERERLARRSEKRETEYERGKTKKKGG